MVRSTPASPGFTQDNPPREEKVSVNTIQRGLCAHLSMLVSRCNIDNSMVPVLASKLSKLDSGTLKTALSEISSLFGNALIGRLDSGINEYHCLGFLANSKRVTVRGPLDSYEPAYLPKDPLLRELVSLDGSSSLTQETWAGMMKLKTVIPARDKRARIPRSELEDHYHSIVDPFVGDVSVVEELQQYIPGITRDLIFLSGLRVGQSDEVFEPLKLVPASDKARTITLLSEEGNLVHCTVPLGELHSLNIRVQLGSTWLRNLYVLDPTRFTERVFIGTSCEAASFDIDKYAISEDVDIPLSTIRFIPQAGMKERVVAVPAEIMQSLSYGIGQVIKSINSSWSVQGVDSHTECTAFLSSKIKEFNGSMTFDSVDQSNYTDRLPYDHVSRVILAQLVNEGILSAFDLMVCDAICHGPVIFPDLRDKITSYGVGTPMGTYPSFPIGSLTNGIVFTAAWMKIHGVKPSSRLTPKVLSSIPCRAIGDDLVSWDHEVFQEYARFMNGIGCKVQPSKCLSSNYIAEMCSKIITSNGVYEQKKIDTLLSAHDLPGFAHNYNYYGDPYLEFVSEQVADEIGILKALPSPYGLAPPLSDSFWDSYPKLRAALSSLKEGRRYESDVWLNASDYDIMVRRSECLIPEGLSFKLDNDDLDHRHNYPPIVVSLVTEIISYSNRILDSTNSDEIYELSDTLSNTLNTLRTFEDRIARANPSYVRYADRHRERHLKIEKPGEDRNRYSEFNTPESIRSGLIALTEDLRGGMNDAERS